MKVQINLTKINRISERADIYIRYVDKKKLSWPILQDKPKMLKNDNFIYHLIIRSNTLYVKVSLF